MNNYITSATRIIIGLAFIGTLYACDSGDNGNSTSSATKTAIPTALQKLTVPTSTGSGLLAFVIVDGKRTAMPLFYDDPINYPGGYATVDIPNLTLDTEHLVSITYEFDDGSGLANLVVATTADKPVTLTSDPATHTLGFAEVDFDMASHDLDGDLISNAAELAAGTDPRVAGAAGLSPCVLGTSTLDNCTL